MKLSRNQIIITLIILVILGVLSIIGFLPQQKIISNIVKTKPVQTVITTNSIKSPLKFLNGFITEIKKDSLTVNAGKIYVVILNSDTKVITQPVVVPYLFKNTVNQPNNKNSAADLKTGYQVLIQLAPLSQSDNRLKAVSVFIYFSNGIQGKIISIDANRLKVEGQPVFSSAEEAARLAVQKKTYTVNVLSDTEISTVPKPEPKLIPRPRLLSVSDLKPGMSVTVYTLSNVENTDSINASRIDPKID